MVNVSRACGRYLFMFHCHVLQSQSPAWWEVVSPLAVKRSAIGPYSKSVVFAIKRMFISVVKDRRAFMWFTGKIPTPLGVPVD